MYIQNIKQKYTDILLTNDAMLLVNSLFYEH